MTLSNWKKTLVEWTEKDTAFLSVVFSWHLPIAHQKAVWYKQQGYQVRTGGPAVQVNPQYLTSVAQVEGHVNALPHHNPNATFTSRGCIRNCAFCAVPTIEGQIQELTDWEPKPIVCDNNLLACSRKHFDRVIDRLRPIKQVDFNQGLDTRLLTDHHAQQLAELDLKAVRLAWDNVNQEAIFRAAYEKLRKAGIWKRKIRVYVLIGYEDTPHDALYRLQSIKDLGVWPNPMRYQPIDTPAKNSYVAPDWTHALLMAYMRYWSNLRRFGSIPFKDWLHRELTK